MKKLYFCSILFLGILFFTFGAFAQTTSVVDDFEGNGTITTWYGDDCGINTSLANPVATGPNTSATVLEYSDGGGQYANVRFDVANNFSLWVNYTFSLKIYVPTSGLTGSQNNQVSLKLQDGTLGAPWSTQSEIIKSIVLDQWQTVTFDFMNDNYINLDAGSPPPTQRTDFNRVVIQVNGENNYDHVLAYIDDVEYNGTVAADPVYDQLVWSDEFDGAGAIDTSKWFHQTQLPNGGSWYNGEIQHYTNRTDNAVLGNGTMEIVAKQETFTDQGVTKNYTSARLNSKFAFTYGRVEVRAKLPTGVGTWPAIWTLGQNITEPGGYWQTLGYGTTGWPACGEIDIMEHWGSNQNYVQSAMHTPSSYGATVNHGGTMLPTASTEFHNYEMVWSPDKIKFSVDGVSHYTYQPAVQDANTWPYDAPQYLIMNVAILPGIASSFTSSSMEVDYVRVYQEGVVSDITETETKLSVVYPNPAKDILFIQTENEIDSEVVIYLYNLQGQVIRTYHKSAIGSTITLDDINLLDAGIYFLQYNIGEKSYSHKFVKE